MDFTTSHESARVYETARISHQRPRLRLSRILLHATILFFCLTIVLPIVWVILMSIKSIPDAYTGSIWPREFDFTHYRYVFEKMPNVLTNFRNSILVTFATVVLTSVCAVLAGYALVHLRLPGRVLVLSILVGTLFFPTRLVSLIGIVLYIWWRFEFTFGLAATIATFHDVLAVLGVVWLLDREITFLTVSGLLTLAGYSLTDTVVVYDRIRENLRGRRRGRFSEVINASINEVLARTAMTSLTILLAVLSLLFVGGPVLWDFAFALALGIVMGTYSSWFVAAPIVYEWRTRFAARGKPDK